MEALRQIASWPSGHKAAGVVTAKTGPLTFGDDAVALPWASVSKLLVAYATLVAAEEGVVGLDDAAGPDGATVRHLLAHASGLGPDGTVLAPPGRTRIYSNEGFNVLARELESKAEMPFAEYLRAAVLAPLGLRAELRGDAGSGLVGALTDLAVFGRELLAPTLVARETLEEAATVQFPGLRGVLPGFGRQDPNDWGLGFELRNGKSPHWTGGLNSTGTFGHFGSKPGSATFLWIDPAAGLACAALVDVDFGEWARRAWPALSDAVLREHAQAGAS